MDSTMDDSGCTAATMEVESTRMEELPMQIREQITFTRLPATEPVEIRFQDLQYRASLGFRKGTKEILHNVHGRFLPAQLIAIMGPSGAGKSTLLDVLSGYRITGVRGVVTINGRERDLDEFRRVSCYITQDDRLQPLLTVRENMKVAADLKLTARYSELEKFAIIDEILTMLGLMEASKTRAGRLSGGQRKRLSIALELVNNPLVMFLDEPTTGLDSASCLLCIKLMKQLVNQGRTIVCTIHQPSASLFQNFDHVYVLAEGECLYQGSANNMVPYLDSVGLPCPMYHNPADYVIELACGEHGKEKILTLVNGTQNGRSIQWFENADQLPPTSHVEVSHKSPRLPGRLRCTSSLQETSQLNQLGVIINRGFVKVKRDSTACCIMFTAIVYLMTGQPLDWNRFIVFMVLSLLVVYIAQSIGYIVGAVFNSVVNGTFAGPILIVPMMMFSGFGVNFRDIPGYLSWGTHLSFLRYSLEGFVGAIYGMDRGILPCEELYCHYRYPDKFMYDVAMRGDVYINCIIILLIMLAFTKAAAYVLLRWKIRSLR
ncbi:ATP-binding cassette subfamily G member 4 isoform X3 [Rhodnius prolixus]|uniref:ATP-binding cassette subfamily G member 4 isoform X3 n=1 Tax=Rhodnius prolixus TaxID=13249 RepID=UPI003D187812